MQCSRAIHNLKGTKMTTATSEVPKRRIVFRWRVVDIIVAAVVGVAFGVVFYGWDLVYAIPTKPLELLLPGTQALLYGVWLIPAVLGALIVRKPGAALFTELVAATLEALLGAQWGGFQTILQGIVQGLGAEVIFAILLYSSWRLWAAILAGAASGASMAINDFINSYAGATVAFKASYGISAVVSGAIIAGVGSWFLVRALARTGALSRFAAGREATVVTSSARG
ncbi:MAG: energy-coupling factor transport system permease protein [Actinomycetota bacterium]|nr:energy-coupling factor transport system permease protein [Actinomycetota bacterium]MDQ1552075.1 energy-coupling factor transport system permease protein [Actinomycetota bacterium]